MPWTKQGPYVTAGVGTAANANNWELQYQEAMSSLELDEVAAFVLTGGVCTIHGGLPKQMDVTACIYYALQSTDTPPTYRQRNVGATNFTTVTASTTYFLDYNADGTTSWGTSHSGAANYLTIASVTTDGSGNINVISDTRNTQVNMYPSAVGPAKFAGKTIIFTGTHNGVVFTLSAGNGAPGSLDTNEIYFQLT